LTNGERVTYCQWRIPHRSADWAPEIDDLDSPAQQLIGFIRQQIAYPLRPGLCRMVDMDSRYRLPQTIATIF
jgi:hypothetical protein